MNEQELQEMRKFKTQEHLQNAIYELEKAQLKNHDNEFIDIKISTALNALYETQDS